MTNLPDKKFDFNWPKSDVASPQVVKITIRGKGMTTPDTKAAEEYAELISKDCPDEVYTSADIYVISFDAFNRGAQAERERIWAEIKSRAYSNWAIDAVGRVFSATVLHRIIFGDGENGK